MAVWRCAVTLLAVPVFNYFLVFLAAAVGGAINSVAGGGTLVTFPAVVWLGVPPLSANATSTVALWPGSLASMWAFRGELDGTRSWLVWFTAPSIVGGLTGALLLLYTPAGRFEKIVPFLVLGATLLFLLQRTITRALARHQLDAGATSDTTAGGTADATGTAKRDVMARPSAWFLLAQFGVAVYGGYFGAGIGILMLATLGLMGLTNIHKMNGLKNWGATCINGFAAMMFVFSGIVEWPVAIAMAAGALSGGHIGASLALRAGQIWVRRTVIAVGFGAFFWLLLAR
jgi:uncharacterized membrane protein YfcA